MIPTSASMTQARVVTAVFLSLLVSVPGAAQAAGKSANDRVTALNRAAVDAYGKGDFKKMKARLQEALKIAKKELDGEPMLARTYLHLGVLYVDGLDNRDAGVKAFTAALKVNPTIQITAGMDTKSVADAFAEARAQVAGHPAPPTRPAPPAPVAEKPPAKAVERPAAAEASAAGDEQDAEDEAPAPPARKLSPKEARAEKKEEAKNAKALKKALADEDRLQKQLAQTQKDLAAAKASAASERAEKERLQHDMKHLVDEAKREVADAKGETKRLAQQANDEAKKQALEAEAEARKQAQDEEKERAARDKQLADADARADKERDAKEKLQQQVQDRDRLLAEAKQALTEAKQRIDQAEKDKAAKDKQLADGLAREAKERDAKEKLQKEKEAAQAREAERKAHEEADRAERAKLAAGPEVPDHFSEAVYCDVPEITDPGRDLYVHCVAQPKLKAREMAFFYRSSGGIYSSLVMERQRKGWFMAMVPGDHLKGRALQYYAEAYGEHGKAANGKPSSPNVLALRAQRGGR